MVRKRASRLPFLVLLAAVPAGAVFAESTLRGDLPRRDGRPLEEIRGLDSHYDVLVTSDRHRLRTILTRPSGSTGRLPGLYFVPWLSCDSIELPASATGGWPDMMRRVFAGSGLVSFRLDKAGVGDSEGPPCARLDYDTELRHHREALRAFRRRPEVDPDRIVLFGASMGATMAPLLADEPGVAAVVVWGGGARTWFERTLAFERRRREGRGLPGAQVTREMALIEELLGEYLIRRRAPDAIASRAPGLAEAWRLLGGLENGLQYGRSAAFHQQAQAADWAGAWEKCPVPVLALLGEHDWFEEPGSAAWIADLVNRRRPGLARFELIPGLDHHFDRYPSLAASVRGEGGRADPEPAVRSILAFLKERLAPGGGAARATATESAGLASYRRAREALDAGVAALGGAEALAALGTVRRRSSGDWFGSGQSRNPHPVEGPTLAPPPTTQHMNVTTVIDYRGIRWLEESLEYDDAGDAITRIRAVTPESGFESLTYRNEKPFFRSFPAEEARALLARAARRHPEGLLRMALVRPETLEWVGHGEAFGRRQRVISMVDPGGTRVLIYFDDETGLPAKSETLRPHAVAGDSHAEILYDDYRPVGSLRLPFHVIDRVAGVPTEETRAAAVEIDPPFPEDRLRPPRVFARMEDDPPRPVVRELGGGLYLIRGTYNTVFAVFRDHVIAVEAPLGARYAEEALAKIEAAAPGKPIRYVVATHFHYDHIAGLPAYAARGASIVTTPDAEGIVRRALSVRHTMSPDPLAGAAVAPRIETVSGRRVFDDGTNRMELHDVGPTDHVGQLLVAWFPRHRVLYEADVWDPVSSGQHIAGADAARLAERIRALGLDVERIIPAHGVPATMRDLERGLAVRAKYAGTAGLGRANAVRRRTGPRDAAPRPGSPPSPGPRRRRCSAARSLRFRRGEGSRPARPGGARTGAGRRGCSRRRG
jgi:dienelactone hydrolase/glyoxylase-like metal-dependent hydrolase (beta-lactamase superfamily II)